MNITPLIEKLNTSRQVFYRAIEGMSENEICNIPVEGIWTVRDLIAHLASWEETILIPLKSYATGGPFQPEIITDHDGWNESQYQRWSSLSLAEIQAQSEAIRQEIVDLLAQISEAQWQAELPAPWGGKGTLADLIAGIAWHESQEHVKGVSAWRQRRGERGPERIDMALYTFGQGFSCSQAVLEAFAADLDLDVESARRVAGAFGGGMARTGETCGAVTGALMAIGLKHGMTDIARPEDKKRTTDLAQDFLHRFQQCQRGLTCKALLAADISTPEGAACISESGVTKSVCPRAVASAVAILEEMGLP